MVFDRSVPEDRRPEPQMPDDDSAAVGRLLDRLERQPSSYLWAELDGLLIVEVECWSREGFAALPALARIAQSSGDGDWYQALDLAAVRAAHRRR